MEPAVEPAVEPTAEPVAEPGYVVYGLIAGLKRLSL
jgi:hypothetical protein